MILHIGTTSNAPHRRRDRLQTKCAKRARTCTTGITRDRAGPCCAFTTYRISRSCAYKRKVPELIKLFLSFSLSLFFSIFVSRKQDNYLRDLQRALCWNASLVQSGASDARTSPFLLPSTLTLLFPCRARCLHDYLLRLHVNANAAPYFARRYASIREYM